MNEDTFKKMISTLETIDVDLNNTCLEIRYGHLTNQDVNSETHNINLTCKVSECYDYCKGDRDTSPGSCKGYGLLLEDVSFGFFTKEDDVEEFLSKEQANSFVKEILLKINTK